MLKREMSNSERLIKGLKKENDGKKRIWTDR
jgi:hypothetical protein